MFYQYLWIKDEWLFFTWRQSARGRPLPVPLPCYATDANGLSAVGLSEGVCFGRWPTPPPRLAPDVDVQIQITRCTGDALPYTPGLCLVSIIPFLLPLRWYVNRIAGNFFPLTQWTRKRSCCCLPFLRYNPLKIAIIVAIVFCAVSVDYSVGYRVVTYTRTLQYLIFIV